MLDITRLARRAGRVATGIDRVEQAYLQRLIAEPVPLWGLARTPFGYLLLDPAGMAAVAGPLCGAAPLPRADLLSRLARGQSQAQRAAQALLRQHAVARCLPRGLHGMLRRRVPAGAMYLNIGHSNLTDRVLQAVRSVPGARVVVMIHDVIPLTHPQYQRPGTVAPFRAKLARVRAHADLILYNSADTRAQTEEIMAPWGDVPPGIVAHLGTIPPSPEPAALPAGLPPEAPYFVCVGTIEPRKNHALLLDVWEALGPDAPTLVIAGSRGWQNAEVFARLDALGADSRVREVSGLSDGALAALIRDAHALLFPSHAEGFGLPALEALQLGTPVLCSNIETFREVLGDRAVYLDTDEWQKWQSRVVDWSKRPHDAIRVDGFAASGWDAHFKIVLSLA